jgi:hypothetical protein
LDKAIKNGIQKDIDNMYMKAMTQFGESTQATNEMNFGELGKFLSRASSSSTDLNSSAFSGQMARLGGISGLKRELDETAAVEEEENDDDMTDGGGNSKPPSKRRNSAGSAGGSGKEKDEKTLVWFERESAIDTAVRNDKKWQNDMSTNLESLLATGNKLLDNINKSAEATTLLSVEIKLNKNRLRAVSLVLGVQDNLTPLTEGTLNNLTSPSPPAKKSASPAQASGEKPNENGAEEVKAPTQEDKDKFMQELDALQKDHAAKIQAADERLKEVNEKLEAVKAGKETNEEKDKLLESARKAEEECKEDKSEVMKNLEEATKAALAAKDALNGALGEFESAQDTANEAVLARDLSEKAATEKNAAWIDLETKPMTNDAETVPETPVKGKDEDAQTSVSSNCPEHLKKVTKALKRYIAGFNQDAKLTPPTRTYRNLVCIGELDELIAKFDSSSNQVLLQLGP